MQVNEYFVKRGPKWVNCPWVEIRAYFEHELVLPAQRRKYIDNLRSWARSIVEQIEDHARCNVLVSNRLISPMHIFIKPSLLCFPTSTAFVAVCAYYICIQVSTYWQTPKAPRLIGSSYFFLSSFLASTCYFIRLYMLHALLCSKSHIIYLLVQPNAAIKLQYSPTYCRLSFSTIWIDYAPGYDYKPTKRQYSCGHIWIHIN